MRANIPVGMLQNDELFNIIAALAISGGADIKTLFMVAQAAGIEAAFYERLTKYGITITGAQWARLERGQ